jgi:hypothetical protein
MSVSKRELQPFLVESHKLFTLSQKRELMTNVWLQIQNFELKVKSLIFYVKSSEVYMYNCNYYHNIQKNVYSAI